MDLFRIIRFQSTSASLEPTYSARQTFSSYDRIDQKLGSLTTFNCGDTEARQADNNQNNELSDFSENRILSKVGENGWMRTNIQSRQT